MHIICIMVSSLDGFTTSGSDSSIHYWTSTEDQKYFAGLIEKAELILMGRKTYEAAKGFMQHRSGRLRTVFTKYPEKYTDAAIPGQLEFTADSPHAVLDSLTKRGFTQALLVGGATLNTAFLEENFIDELWLTVEPVVLGDGNLLFANYTEPKKLKLLSVEKLNNRGTILLKYSLLK